MISMGILIVMDSVHIVVNDSRGLVTNETAWRHLRLDSGGLLATHHMWWIGRW
jgi:hypothetical protein